MYFLIILRSIVKTNIVILLYFVSLYLFHITTNNFTDHIEFFDRNKIVFKIVIIREEKSVIYFVQFFWYMNSYSTIRGN